MSRRRILVVVFFAIFGCFLSSALSHAFDIPGNTPEERAINGAKAYMKAHGLKTLTLNVLINPLHSEAIRHVSPAFENATGIKLNVIAIGYTEIPTKMMAEAVAKTGAYDVIMHHADAIPDGAESGLLHPFDEWMKKYGPDMDGFLKFADMGKYGGKVYGFEGDGSALALYMRKDLIDDPKERKNFRAKYGYELGCPETWEQYRDIAEFFTRDTDGDGKIDLYGAVDYRARKFASKWWLERFLTMGKLPFDENMKPLITGPEGIKATEQFVEIGKFMPQDALGWGTAQLYPFWISGKVASFIGQGSAISYARNPERKPNLRDKTLTCLCPGSRAGGRLIRRSVHWSGPFFLVSNYASHPELAYAFSQWITSPEISTQYVAFPRGVSKPYRKNHATDPTIINTYGENFLDVHMKNLQILAPAIHLVGHEEYMDALDVNLLAIIVEGKITPKEAMERTAAAWEKTTDDIGRKKQIQAWRAQIPLYPTIDVPK